MFQVTFTYIASPDGRTEYTDTRKFENKQQAWQFVKALDKHSRAKLSTWSINDAVMCPGAPCSQPLKKCFVFDGSKQVFSWSCPSISQCEDALQEAIDGSKVTTRFFVTDRK